MIRSSTACANALFTLTSLALIVSLTGCAEPAGAGGSVDEPDAKVEVNAGTQTTPEVPSEDAAVLAAADPAAGDPAGAEAEAGAEPDPEAEAGAEPETDTGDEPETAEADAEVAAADASPDDDADLEPRRVLIVGSSLAATGLGAVLEDLLDANPDIVAYRKGKSASGLARPDFYDWFDQGKRQVEFRKPDLVIVLIGANDGQDLPPWKGDKRVRWDSEGWPDAYRVRVDDFLASVMMSVEGAPGAKVLWLGLPKVPSPSLERKLKIIRGLHEERIGELGDAGVYLDTTQYLVDANGQLLKTSKVRGKQRELRSEDGVHFTMSGCEYLAAKLYPEVLGALGLAAESPEPAE